MGWLMKGVPSGSFRRCPLCFLAAKSTASSSAAASEPMVGAAEATRGRRVPSSRLLRVGPQPAPAPRQPVQQRPVGSAHLVAGGRNRSRCRCGAQRPLVLPQAAARRRAAPAPQHSPHHVRADTESLGQALQRPLLGQLLPQEPAGTARSPRHGPRGTARPARPRSSPHLFHRPPAQGALGGAASPAQLPPQPLQQRCRPPPPRPAGRDVSARPVPLQARFPAQPPRTSRPPPAPGPAAPGPRATPPPLPAVRPR